MKHVATSSLLALAFLVATSGCDTVPTSSGPTPLAEVAHSTAANIDDLSRVSGGGQIRHDEFKVSFGGSVEGAEASLEVQFHNVSDPAVVGGTFEATGVLAGINFFAPTSTECVWAMNVTLAGTFNGEAASLIYRAGDAGTGKVDDDDTIRFELSHAGGVYDTRTDFAEESNCAGTVRTGLDAGNIMIR